MEHVDQLLGAIEEMKAKGQSAGDSILDFLLIRTLKLDAERNVPGGAARLMAEYKGAELQANIDREADLNEALKHQKEEMADVKRQREEIMARHAEDLRRITAEEEESIRRASEFVRMAQEQRAASSTGNEGSAILDLATMEQQEKEEKEVMQEWKRRQDEVEADRRESLRKLGASPVTPTSKSAQKASVKPSQKPSELTS